MRSFTRTIYARATYGDPPPLIGRPPRLPPSPKDDAPDGGQGGAI
jgi:hypothetical protein